MLNPGIAVQEILVIQGVSRLVDITAWGDFLGLCDQKSSYEHVSDFGRLRSYGHFLIPLHALVWTASYGTIWRVMYWAWWLIVCGSCFKSVVAWLGHGKSSRLLVRTSTALVVMWRSEARPHTWQHWNRSGSRFAFICVTTETDSRHIMFWFTTSVCAGTERSRAGLEARIVDTFGTELK